MLKNLKELSLAANEISALPFQLSALEQLINLNVSGNNLVDDIWMMKDEEGNVREILPKSIEELSMSKNLMTTIPPISYLTNLKILELADNRIEEVNASHLPSSDSLLVLNLSTNGITSIEKELVSKLKNIYTLNLSENHINNIDNLMLLFDKPSLTQLDLSCNEISSLPTQFFQDFPNLKSFSLANNNLSSFHDLISSFNNNSNDESSEESNNDIGNEEKYTTMNNNENIFNSLSVMDLTGNSFSHQLHLLNNNSGNEENNQNNNNEEEEEDNEINRITNYFPNCKIDWQFPLPDKIIDNLYLGDWYCSRNKNGLKKLGITHVLVVAQFPILYPQHFTYKQVYVADENKEDLLSNFDSCYEFISEARKLGAILIHCRAGVSRSATVTAAYLMKKSKEENRTVLNGKEALLSIKEKRPRIGPNDGFKAQLDLYYDVLSKKDDN
eukprot:TRINITY_DN4014_c0_g1_i1.p1 TRINITY_DN4014_c0_g1~~TRINITY_DN4014_c0_g1_i1.p1  ORF type:complete len:443 (+),score=115.35 TRINITY_DN4014_c0_g1_i1:270-1598(+)